MVGGGGENYAAWSDEPYGWFVEKAGYGKIINIDVDEDGVLRRFPIVSEVAGMLAPHFYFRVLCEHKGYDINNIELKMKLDYLILVKVE